MLGAVAFTERGAMVMKAWGLGRCALTSCTTAALLAGCGGASQPFAPAGLSSVARNESGQLKIASDGAADLGSKATGKNARSALVIFRPSSRRELRVEHDVGARYRARSTRTSVDDEPHERQGLELEKRHDDARLRYRQRLGTSKNAFR